MSRNLIRDNRIEQVALKLEHDIPRVLNWLKYNSIIIIISHLFIVNNFKYITHSKIFRHIRLIQSTGSKSGKVQSYVSRNKTKTQVVH